MDGKQRKKPEQPEASEQRCLFRNHVDYFVFTRQTDDVEERERERRSVEISRVGFRAKRKV